MYIEENFSKQVKFHFSKFFENYCINLFKVKNIYSTNVVNYIHTISIHLLIIKFNYTYNYIYKRDI